MLQEEEQMLVNMKKILEIAEAEGYAIPCINTPNEETVRAVIGAAEELNTPIIIDHAQVHDSLIPIERIGPIMLKYAKEARVPVCVHLDHGSDYEFVMRAVKVGFPSIMYDCSALPFEENVEKVAQFVKFAHAAGITVEAELGIMASTDEDTHDDDPEKRVLTNEDIREFFTEPAEAKEFAERTKCDALAVCFGTMHEKHAMFLPYHYQKLLRDNIHSAYHRIHNDAFLPCVVFHVAPYVYRVRLQLPHTRQRPPTNCCLKETIHNRKNPRIPNDTVHSQSCSLRSSAISTSDREEESTYPPPMLRQQVSTRLPMFSQKPHIR